MPSKFLVGFADICVLRVGSNIDVGLVMHYSLSHCDERGVLNGQVRGRISRCAPNLFFPVQLEQVSMMLMAAMLVMDLIGLGWLKLSDLI